MHVILDRFSCFQEDFQERPHISKAINALANYSAAIPSGPADPEGKQQASARLGTIMGVFLPCIQNIFGVILFIRYLKPQFFSESV
jgi:potassium/chloride transporter 4/5/6